jgi:NADH dehydrogenase FAD-containing subunit
VDGKPISYDYLVVAMGSTSHDYGIPGVGEYALPPHGADQLDIQLLHL